MIDDTRDEMSQEFAALFEASLKSTTRFAKGQPIEGVIVAIAPEVALVSVGGKGEASISVEELKDDDGDVEVNVGDRIKAVVVSTQGGLTLSRRMALGAASLGQLEEAYRSGLPVEGKVMGVVKGGYEERFFVDSTGELVPREAFKTHVEAMGLKVTERLDLANYRGVILKSVVRTRESLNYRRLAEEHSLAPGPLLGLDLIAASMGPEAISFKSLQAIVVDRISQEVTNPGETRRELKKNVRDVDKWLDSQKHLSEAAGRTTSEPQSTESSEHKKRQRSSASASRTSWMQHSRARQQHSTPLSRPPQSCGRLSLDSLT